MKYRYLSIPIFCSAVAISSCTPRTKGNEEEKPTAQQVVTPPKKTAVEKADSVKEVKRHRLDEDETDFILKAADARMMGILEGKAAVEKSRSPQIKQYGSLMIKDQTSMLNALKKVAEELSVHLPDSISADKKDGLSKLMALSGKKFDKKFTRMMKIDHRRDIKLFTKAKDYENEIVKAYAAQFEPLIESHLDQLKQVTRRKPKKKGVPMEKVIPN